jgi:hypothetical protein
MFSSLPQHGFGGVGGSSGGNSNGGQSGGDNDSGSSKSGKRNQACDLCHREHKPCIKTDPNNPQSACVRCNHFRLVCTYNRQRRVRRRRPEGCPHPCPRCHPMDKDTDTVLFDPEHAEPNMLNTPGPNRVAFPSIASAFGNPQGASLFSQSPLPVSPELALLTSYQPSSNTPPISVAPIHTIFPSSTPHNAMFPYAMLPNAVPPSTAHTTASAVLVASAQTALAIMSPSTTPSVARATMSATTPAGQTTTITAQNAVRLPSLTAFRDLFYHQRQPALWEFYTGQARTLTQQDQALVLNVLERMLGAVQRASNETTSDGGGN